MHLTSLICNQIPKIFERTVTEFKMVNSHGSSLVSYQTGKPEVGGLNLDLGCLFSDKKL